MKICRLIVMKILMFVLFFWLSQIKEHLAKGQRTLAGDGMSQVTKTLLDLTQRKNFYAGDLLMSVEILRNVTDTFKRASYIPASDGVQVRDNPLNEKISEHAFRFWPWEASAAALWRRSGLEGKSTYSYRGHIRVMCLVWALEMTSILLVIVHLSVLNHKMLIIHLKEILNENVCKVFWALR